MIYGLSTRTDDISLADLFDSYHNRVFQQCDGWGWNWFMDRVGDIGIAVALQTLGDTISMDYAP